MWYCNINLVVDHFDYTITMMLILPGNKYGERPELEQLLRHHMSQESSNNDVTLGEYYKY